MQHYISVFSQGPSPLLERVLQGVYRAVENLECPLVERMMGTDLKPAQLRHCAGMIAVVPDAKVAGNIRKLPFPVINVSNSGVPWKGMGRVRSDDVAIGRMAARHLLKRGYRSFMGIGQAKRVFSKERLAGFAGEIARQGGNCLCRDIDGDRLAQNWSPLYFQDFFREQIGKELDSLPADAAIFAVADWIAWPILRLINDKFSGRMYTTAILGVDNLHDGYMDPRISSGLSSIKPGFFEVGQVALSSLLKHINTPEAIEQVDIRIAPEEVIERASTAGPACSDPLTARALRQMWINVHSGRPVGIQEIARAGGMSVRTLERKFINHMDRSARETLAEMRLDFGRELLRTTLLPVADVAYRTGFSEASTFTTRFRKAFGVSPRQWRKTAGSNGGSG